MASPQLMPYKKVEVLLVEDNPGDIRLLQEAFKECEATSHLNITRDGEQALAYLRQEGCYANIEDVRHAYDLHANCYVPKPFDIDKLQDLGRALENFWLSTVLLPN
jgi:chemotaxis family two-component system response regulator Rcp1